MSRLAAQILLVGFRDNFRMMRSLLPNSLKYLYEKLKLNAGEVVPVFCPSTWPIWEHQVLPQVHRFQLSILKDVLRWSVKQCHHIFCWHCLQSLQGDLFLRHYDEGPCKDKLGHPRIGLFVHRFGVSGTFWLIL
ncbi:RNF144A [Cordylochernes scorpioides]|uniref:RNF144A n=1 Tax=Cordylochernes scorpioides TaxID=51811 RepID=A0ABY6K7R2_9ARAC|nr:RNF144A [Cordylochernes scorpioides]